MTIPDNLIFFFNKTFFYIYIPVQIIYFIAWQSMYSPVKYVHNTVPISNHTAYIIISILFFLIPLIPATITRIFELFIKKKWVITIVSIILSISTIIFLQLLMFLAMFLTLKP